jgi:hypothetical protein
MFSSISSKLPSIGNLTLIFTFANIIYRRYAFWAKTETTKDTKGIDPAAIG